MFRLSMSIPAISALLFSYFRVSTSGQAVGGSAAAADVAVSGFVRRSLVQDWPRGPLYEQPQINAPATVAVTPVNFA